MPLKNLFRILQSVNDNMWDAQVKRNQTLKGSICEDCSSIGFQGLTMWSASLEMLLRVFLVPNPSRSLTFSGCVRVPSFPVSTKLFFVLFALLPMRASRCTERLTQDPFTPPHPPTATWQEEDSSQALPQVLSNHGHWFIWCNQAAEDRDYEAHFLFTRLAK